MGAISIIFQFIAQAVGYALGQAKGAAELKKQLQIQNDYWNAFLTQNAKDATNYESQIINEASKTIQSQSQQYVTNENYKSIAYAVLLIVVFIIVAFILIRMFSKE